MTTQPSHLLASLALGYTIFYIWGYLRSSKPDNSRHQIAGSKNSPSYPSTRTDLTTLQQHVLFWDRDGDSIIYPHDVYTGFRELGFSIPFSLTALLIPIFFSYPTRLGHSYIPDPFLRIYVDSIHKAKHGSDTGVYDLKGNFRAEMFDGLFREFDGEGRGALHAWELWRMVGRNRVAADVAGWTFAVMEWVTTWLLLQREGRVWKEDLRACYDGSLFWRLKEEREGGVVKRGYGVEEFRLDVMRLFRGKEDLKAD
ncbi:Caleosin related protein-domain-containing protein [Rhexocercosporidium sp. MPI-PUGE-AT-0058]|nr:Caleosin related protein-domain-containing protein [Rhexocercosporidium sp. MPI-PUGE-AT-0058]